MNPDIEKLQAKIRKIQNKIEELQFLCSHPGLKITHGGNTGNLCEVDDQYWTNYRCPWCDKRWTEYHKKSIN